MPDTTHVLTQQEFQNFLDSLPDSLRAVIGKSITSVEQKDDLTLQSIAITLAYIFALILVLFFVVKIIDFLKPPTNDNTETIINIDETGSQLYMYNGYQLGLSDIDIITILEKHYTYYYALVPALRQLFIQRVKKFMSLKTFFIPGNETYKEVPVLLSAAAIQLTFGLEDYELPWFSCIRIHAEEYFAEDPHALRVLAGHVEDNIITIAWSHFLKGIKDEQDGVNVGLHEMAHALYYQHVIAHNGKKKVFIKELSDVMEESEEIYALKNTYKVLYSDYAYKNLQEFWAESIELFFEKPAGMQQHYKDLYENLKELLNQDPLNKSNPLLA